MNRREALTAVGVGLAAGLVPAAATAGVSRLPALIAAFQVAHAAFCHQLNIDENWELPETKRAGDADDEALLAIIIYRPVSPDDARTKVDFLGRLNKRHMMPDWSVDALLESLLPEGETLSEAFTDWNLHEGDVS